MKDKQAIGQTKREWDPATNSYNVTSKDIAKGRLLEAIAAAHDNQVVKDGNHGISETTEQVQQTEIDRLADELVKKDAAVKVLMAENKELEKRIETINEGRRDETASWRGKLAMVNIELDNLKRKNHNREAFAEARK